MLRIPKSSRWQIRLVGLTILIVAGLLSQPLVAQSPSATMEPASEILDAPSVTIACKLTNKSFKPGQKVLVGTVEQKLAGQVKILATDSAGNPVAGVPVCFEIVTTPKKSKKHGITAKSITGPDGIAVADLTLGAKDGSYLITARTNNMLGEMPRIKAVGLKGSWWVFLVFGLVGGLGLFLYGMELGSGGLQKVAGSRMRSILGALTTNRFMGLMLGTIVTALVQSSSATTVMVVGFVSAGLMTLTQSLGVVLGAHIGTTITVQLIAFKITDYALLMVGSGFVMTMVTKRKTYIYIGEIILGFGMIFYGMAVMSDAMRPLQSMPVFSNMLLSLGDNALLGILASAVFTGLIQSSGATIGLAVVLASDHLLDLSAAMPIILGANIGTTVTTLLAMAGASVEGRRAGMAHLVSAVAGVIVFFPLLRWFVPLVTNITQTMGSVSVAREVANGHMIYNIINSFMFIPFVGPLGKLVTMLVPSKKEVEKPKYAARYLNNDLLETPDMALASAWQEILRVSDINGEMIRQSLDMYSGNGGEAARDTVREQGEGVQSLCEDISRYYIRLSQKEIGLMQSREKHGHMSIVDDLRQMAQLVGTDMADSATALTGTGGQFTDEGRDELRNYLDFTWETHEETEEAMRERDLTIAKKTRKRKNGGEEYERGLRESHLSRLDAGLEQAAITSTAHMDFLTAMRQLGRHHFRVCRILGEFLEMPS
jgi:phosphate:Na+ symporter